MVGLCTKDKIMNLGFDLDEVIAQMSLMAINYANDALGTDYTIDVFKNFMFEDNLYFEDEEKQKAMIVLLTEAINKEECTSSILPYDGAVKNLQRLKRQGHDIYIITKRPKNLLDVTSNWLLSHKVPCDKLVLTDNKCKGESAVRFELDMFVDDLEQNLYGMHKSKKRWPKGLLLMTRPWNRDSYIDGSKFIRVHNWDDILRQVGIKNRLRS